MTACPPASPVVYRHTGIGHVCSRVPGSHPPPPPGPRPPCPPCSQRKEKRATSYLYDDEHVTMTLLLTSGSNHTIHIFVEHTAPHRRGGANQNDHRPSTGGGGGDEDKQDQTGKATRPNKTTTHLTGKGGYHGVGGGRGGVAALHHIYSTATAVGYRVFPQSARGRRLGPSQGC